MKASKKVNILLNSLILASLLFLSQCSTGSNIESGEKENQTVDNEWIKTKTGNMPLVISAPHGGTVAPDEIPDRTCQGATTVRDRNTTELAFEMENQLKEQFDIQPYIVASLISRKKIDLNRDIQDATCGNSAAKEIWNEYHDQLEASIASAIEEFGGVIFIDFHGHGHEKQRLELGYLLSKAELKESFNDAETAKQYAGKSSLRNLMATSNGLNFQELLTGENAFGTLMEGGGVPAVPSLEDPFPGSEDAYFTGGYNTRRYTSEEYPHVFGWQIEANFNGVRDSEKNRTNFAKVFSEAIMVQVEEFITDQLKLKS